MKISVFGNGRIGSAAVTMLREAGHDPAVYDINDTLSYDADVILAATPWQMTKVIAREVALRSGKLYFDLTEDVAAGKAARNGSRSVMFPHCGLAPGAVSIIAGSMATDCIIMRVGALPQVPVGPLKYALTWNTWGLVNEYTRPCPALIDGAYHLLDPLANLVDLDDEYEAFNTSGGIGTFAETSSVRHAMYQTIRYRGHCREMKSLLKVMSPDDLVDLLDRDLPRGGPDKVIIRVNDYHKTIFPKDGMSAIQRTTAAGAVAVILWALEHELPVRDNCWVALEDIPLGEISQYRCWNDVF